MSVADIMPLTPCATVGYVKTNLSTLAKTFDKMNWTKNWEKSNEQMNVVIRHRHFSPLLRFSIVNAQRHQQWQPWKPAATVFYYVFWWWWCVRHEQNERRKKKIVKSNEIFSPLFFSSIFSSSRFNRVICVCVWKGTG